ncbi:MAG: hypothetical protein LBF84_02390 [Holosporales bacterium]|jgi:hypothetical protein|nr:hypothetical protein [Holosporales bacterium]
MKKFFNKLLAGCAFALCLTGTNVLAAMLDGIARVIARDLGIEGGNGNPTASEQELSAKLSVFARRVFDGDPTATQTLRYIVDLLSGDPIMVTDRNRSSTACSLPWVCLTKCGLDNLGQVLFRRIVEFEYPLYFPLDNGNLTVLHEIVSRSNTSNAAATFTRAVCGVVPNNRVRSIIDLTDGEGKTAVQIAMEKSWWDSVACLLECGATFTEDLFEQLNQVQNLPAEVAFCIARVAIARGEDNMITAGQIKGAINQLRDAQRKGEFLVCVVRIACTLASIASYQWWRKLFDRGSYWPMVCACACSTTVFAALGSPLIKQACVDIFAPQLA